MEGNPAHRMDMSGFEHPKIQLVSSPSLSWRDQDSNGVIRSGWNPFKGLVVSMADEATSNQRVSLIIEPPSPGIVNCCMMFFPPFFPLFWPMMCPQLIYRAIAHAYFFEHNASGTIDLLHRMKPFFGVEIRKTYRDCTHFRAIIQQYRKPPADDMNIDSGFYTHSYFILTYEGGEIKLPTGENFPSSSLAKLREITSVINGLIAVSLEHRVDLNDDLRPETGVEPCSVVLPVAAGYYVTGSSKIYPQDALYAATENISDATSFDDSAVNVSVCEASLYNMQMERV